MLFTDGADKRFEQSPETLCKKLKKILSSSEVPLQVKEAAVEASFGCILRLKNPANDEFLQDLLRKAMNTVFSNGEIKFDVSQEGYARLIRDQWVALARGEGWFLRNQIDKVVKFTFSIMENPEYEGITRFPAIEFVLALIEDKKGCQILVNTGDLPSKRMLSQSMIATINENMALDNINERDQARLRFLGQGMKSMARFSQALGARFLREGFPQPFEPCFSSEAWQRREAAISSLSIIAKNCPKALKSKVDLVANPVMKMVEDTHHRVRWGAVYAVEEFSNHLPPEFQNHYHQEVLPALTKAMDDFSDSNIQVQAAMGTYYFVVDCTSNMLEPHLDEIISKLLRCLQKGKQLLKQWALSALAAIAKSSQDQFLEYYRTVMPNLTFVMMKAKGESNGMLLSATVASITVVWTVVGKEKFGDDTQKVVELLFSTPISNLEIDDPLRIEGLNAWGRLRTCLDHEFQPCMEVAIPCLLQSAQLILPDDGDIEEPDERMIQIKAETLEEKATACVLLRDCVAELKEGIDLWIDEIAETLVPLLNFYQHGEVRIAAVLDMHHCVRWGAMYAVEEFSKHLRPEFQNHYHQEVLPALTKAMDDFSNSNIQVQPAMAIYYFVEDCTSNMLEPHLDEIISKLLGCLQIAETLVPHGIGVAAAFGGSIFKPLVGEALSALNASIGHPRALRRDYILAHDAALPALEELCKCLKASRRNVFMRFYRFKIKKRSKGKKKRNRGEKSRRAEPAFDYPDPKNFEAWDYHSTTVNGVSILDNHCGDYNYNTKGRCLAISLLETANAKIRFLMATETGASALEIYKKFGEGLSVLHCLHTTKTDVPLLLLDWFINVGAVLVRDYHIGCSEPSRRIRLLDFRCIDPSNEEEISKELKRGPLMIGFKTTDRMDRDGITTFDGSGKICGGHAATLIGEGTNIKGPHWVYRNNWGGKWGFRSTGDGKILKSCITISLVCSLTFAPAIQLRINMLFTDGADKRFEQSLETLCKKLKKILSSSEVSLKVKEEAVEASFGCILRLKNPGNDEFLQDLLRKVMDTVFSNGEIKFDMSQEGYARLILDQLVALARGKVGS